MNFPFLKLKEAEIDEIEGEAVEITLTWESEEPGTYGSQKEEEDPEEEPVELGEPVLEISWDEVQIQLEANPMCPELDAEAMAAGIGWDNWEKLAEAGTGEDQIIGLRLKEHGGAWTREKYIKKKLAGINHYLVKAPVIRRTTRHFTRPAGVGVGCYEAENPPVGSFQGISSYAWIKGPETLTRSDGIWTRVTEWRGAQSWDPDLYGTPPAPS